MLFIWLILVLCSVPNVARVCTLSILDRPCRFSLTLIERDFVVICVLMIFGWWYWCIMITMLLPSSENMHTFFPSLIANVSWETWSNSEIISECYRPLTELLRNIPKRKQRKINAEYRSLDKPNRQKEPGYIHITYVLKCCFLLLCAWWSPDLKMWHQIKWETYLQCQT